MQAQIVELEKASRDILDGVAQVIKGGGVIIFPTDTIYGLGGDAFNEAVIKRIYEIKGRSSEKPFSLHLGGLEETKKYCRNLTAKQELYLKKLLPGPFTVILQASPTAPKASVNEEGKLGLRVPDSESFRLIYEQVKIPLVGTSVNRSGQPPLTDINAIIRDFAAKVDLIITTEEKMTQQSSAVIDLTVDPPVALRGELPHHLKL